MLFRPICTAMLVLACAAPFARAQDVSAPDALAISPPTETPPGELQRAYVSMPAMHASVSHSAQFIAAKPLAAPRITNRRVAVSKVHLVRVRHPR